MDMQRLDSLHESNRRFLFWLYQNNPGLKQITEENGIYRYLNQEIRLDSFNLTTLLKNETLHQEIPTISAFDFFSILSIYANMPTFERALPYYKELLSHPAIDSPQDQNLLYFMHGLVANLIEYEEYLNDQVHDAFKDCYQYYIDLELSDDVLTDAQSNALLSWHAKQDEVESKKRDKTQDLTKRLILSKDNVDGSAQAALILILIVAIGVALGSILYLIY